MLQDKLLVIKCKYGNKDAMCQIYGRYKDFLLTLAKGLVGEQELAEDIVHDVFVNFALSIKKFKLTGSLKGYLATCVSNLARDRIRSRTRQAVILESVNESNWESSNPLQSLAESEKINRLREALEQIPYEQREVILLHIKAGMKFREIAESQNQPLSTIHGRYRYGIDKLRSLMNSEVTK
ncbi:MAG: sigma-70 family RNA polymerase sigma factor [Sedimentisphaerales bacterium]|nr:sigma-70 family RNA polymerase sigma factor [Sedimentisphaerales bacterium]